MQRATLSLQAASLLYRLHSGGQKTGVEVDPKLFREAFTSKYNKVRIWQVMNVSKASKAWVADAANRVCDAPGSWYCPGQYPPALAKLMSKRKNFKQVEDFNTDASEEEKAYNEEYMRRMAGH
jgi:dolichyl-diphosphooligosaccharide--protein glycosyltransferase